MASSAIGDVLRTHTRTECLPLTPLPSHSKSQGLASCFPVEREISDSEEAVFNLYNYTVYTNRVKKSSKDTKANLSLGSLNTQINMQFPVTLLQELNSVEFNLHSNANCSAFLTIYLKESVLQKANNGTFSAKSVLLMLRGKNLEKLLVKVAHLSR